MEIESARLILCIGDGNSNNNNDGENTYFDSNILMHSEIMPRRKGLQNHDDGTVFNNTNDKRCNNLIRTRKRKDQSEHALQISTQPKTQPY